jgi:hypothetical protein
MEHKMIEVSEGYSEPLFFNLTYYFTMKASGLNSATKGRLRKRSW